MRTSMTTETKSPAGAPAKDEPYCSNCGYVLRGLTESAKCPECGRPLVEVLARRNWAPNFGKRYKSRAMLFGLPVIHVAVGPRDGELRGKARGIIAVGGVARGIVAVGGLALGVFAVGGFAVGLVAAAGGGAVGGIAAGGGAAGILANGGGSVGVVAQGGGALGVYTRDGRSPRGGSSAEPFASLDWFFGPWPPNAISSLQPMLVTGGMVLAAAAVIGLIALLRLRRQPDETAAVT